MTAQHEVRMVPLPPQPAPGKWYTLNRVVMPAKLTKRGAWMEDRG